MASPEEKRWWRSFSIALSAVSIILLVHVIKEWTGWPIYYWGIYPGEWIGLRGILFSPFIHGDWSHLIWNGFPLFALTLILFYFYPRVARNSLIMIFLMTGFSVWLFGQRNFHIGASGVIYGMLAFVFCSGLFRRNVKSIVLALIILFFYQGFFSGLIPKEGVSWESHLFGALSGAFAAYFYKDHIEADEVPKRPSWENEPVAAERFFLSRDVFDMTKQQRAEERRRAAENDWTSDTSL